MRTKLKTILAVIAVGIIVGAAAAWAATTYSSNAPETGINDAVSTGTSGIIVQKGTLSAGGGVLPTLQVYSDAAMQNKTTSLAWGVLDPGQNKTETVYLYSDDAYGSVTAAMVNPYPADFENYSSLVSSNLLLPANQLTPFNLTLVISPNIVNTNITDFSFQILITMS